MHVLLVSSEMSPIAKAGGLGDVIQGLSYELQKLEQKVTVVLPKYSFIEDKNLHAVKIHSHFKSFEKGNWYDNTAWSAHVNGVKVFFIETHHPHGYFQRPTIYGYEDDIIRFSYFSRAVFDFLRHENLDVDVIHIHDWPTALLSILYKDLHPHPSASIILTIHNIEHQGRCGAWDLDAAGLNSHLYKEKLKDPLYDSLNLLQGGILYADQITTVSPTYAQEILTKEYGYGLDPLLRTQKNKVTGILNGIDINYWNPQTDPHIVSNYGAKIFPRQIAFAKKLNKKALQRKMGLTEGNGPLIISIGRLVTQKGPILLKQAIQTTIQKGGQFALLGTSPIPEMEEEFVQLQKKLPPSEALFFFELNEPLAHWLYAAADFIIIPSLFEPCGLTQLIALRYGTIPIVRSTGGLKDTIMDGVNGYTFTDFTTEAMNTALLSAIQDYKEKPKKILELSASVMKEDHSWNVSAKEYLALYQKNLRHTH